MLYVDDNYFNSNNNNLCRYSTKLSTSYEIVDNKNIIISKPSIYSSDYFNIYTDIAITKFETAKLEFLYYLNPEKNVSYACGKVGFLFPSEKKGDLWRRNFINQIHNNIQNIDYSFTFRFDTDNEGYLIIGIESYEKTIKNENLISIYNQVEQYGNKQKWVFDMERIFVKNKFYQFEEGEFFINTDIEGFEFPYLFFMKLEDIFFSKYFDNNICKYKYIIIAIKFIAISCDAEKFGINDIKSFPEIKFLKYKLGFNFTFSGEELFYKKNNTYFFKIIFNSMYYKKGFKLGRLFLKKYQVIFNPDSNYVNFYKLTQIKEKRDYIKKEDYLNSGIFFRYFFISFIFFIVGFYLGRKFCLLRRNKYAKELEDDAFILDNEKNNINKENFEGYGLFL